MAIAEPTNTRKTGVDTQHSAMLTLLPELNGYMWARVDTVRMAKWSQQSFCH